MKRIGNITRNHGFMSILVVIVLIAGLTVVQAQDKNLIASRLYNHAPYSAITGTNINPDHSQYAQFYQMTTGQAHKTHIEPPLKYDITHKIPGTVYFSYQMQAVPYSQYQNYATYTGGNSLWIQGSASWTQYVQVPQGSSLSLLATSSTGGNGYLYQINPDGTLTKNGFYFYPGSNQIAFYANAIGQHIMLFVIDGQVSNAIVIDVTSYDQPSIPNYPTMQAILPITIVTPTSGDTPATIISQGMRGYQVFLDGNYIGTEGTGGDQLDGKFSFTVVGNQNHEVRVYDGQFNYPKTMYFQRGIQKIFHVEPGTAVYV
jgi:hypothetical protein